MINDSFGGAMGGTGEAMKGMSACRAETHPGFNAYMTPSALTLWSKKGPKGLRAQALSSRAKLRSGGGMAVANYGNMMW
jgi:hypothetical protein